MSEDAVSAYSVQMERVNDRNVGDTSNVEFDALVLRKDYCML
jgi:hypothetical protein